MKLEKAIMHLEDLRDGLSLTQEAEEKDSLSLGIEALKVIKDVRPTDYGAIDDPLPGETEE